MKQEEARRINTEFSVNQSRVFQKISNIIENDPDNIEPIFKNIQNEGELKYFKNAKDVESFWRG